MSERRGGERNDDKGKNKERYVEERLVQSTGRGIKAKIKQVEDWGTG